MGLNHNIINFGVFLFVCWFFLDCFERQTENANRGENKQEALSFPAVASTSIKRQEIGKNPHRDVTAACLSCFLSLYGCLLLCLVCQ